MNFFFWCQGIFYMIFDFKNGRKNEFKDKKGKIMQLIQKKGFSQNRFQSPMAAQQPCRQRGS